MKMGEELIGQSIWVNWPHMFEARVISLESHDHRVDREGKDNSKLIVTASDERKSSIFLSLTEGIAERWDVVYDQSFIEHWCDASPLL